MQLLGQVATISLTGIIIVVAVAFIPPLLFAGAIAKAKRYRKEPGYALRRAFVWGASGAALISLVVNTVASDSFARPYAASATQLSLMTAVIIAPLVEETAKAFGLVFVKREADEPVDGLIYGAHAGLGFSATENLFYEMNALVNDGIGAWMFVALGRTFSSSFLHAVASALVGYGIARMWVERRPFSFVVPWWGYAVGAHAAFNFVASIDLGLGLLSLFLLVGVAIWAFRKVRSNVEAMSLQAPHRVWYRVGGSREVKVWQPAGPSRTSEEPPVRYKRLGGKHPSQIVGDDED